MRTRSSASIDDDNQQDRDSNEQLLRQPQAITPSPRNSLQSESDKVPFTSAKFDVARHSDTLDRRKVEKALSSQSPNSPLSPKIQNNEWQAESRGSGNIPEKLRQDLAHATGNQASSHRATQDKMLGRLDRGRTRVRSPWRISLLTLTATFSAICILLAIMSSFFTKQLDTKGYRMSWSRPAFAKFTGFDTEYTRFASKYSLYLYREQGVDEDLRVKGVPVLFIPGNAGSYKQMRPLASDAAHWFAENVQQNSESTKAGIRGLDFFTTDFNEEFSAFHGQTILDQAEYLNDAVSYILSLYHDPKRSHRDSGLPDPTSVIIVGHSMGGIVARTMLVMPNYQSNSINTIITMSTPHARAPVTFDSGIVSTYQTINDYWRRAYSQKWASDNPLWHVTLISIAGGGLDTIVPSDYTSLASLVPDTHGFTVFTSGIPTVWTGTDHLSIIWCDQLSKVIPRALIEATDVTRPGQTKPRAERMRIFKKWFLTGMEDVVEKTLPQKDPTTLLTLEDNSNSILTAGEKLTIRKLGSSGKPKAYLLPVQPQSTPGSSRFTLLSDQLLDEAGAHGTLEVLLCSVYPIHPGQSAQLFSMNMDLSGSTSGSTRLACKNAASDVIKLPASSTTSRFPFDDGAQPFSYLQFDLDEITEHQFVAVVDKGNSHAPGWVFAEFSDNAHSTVHSGVGLGKLLTSGLRLSLPAGRPLLTGIKVPAIHSSLLAYKLKVHSSSCGDNTPLFEPLLRQYMSEPFESKFFVNVKETDINLHGIAPFMPPALRAHAITDGLSLQMWSDPTCNSSVDLDLQVDLMGSLGKLVMRYRTVFPAIPLMIIALVLRKQFMTHDKTGIFMTFTEALDRCLRSSLPVLLLAMTFLSMSLASSSSHPAGSTSSNYLHWRRNSTEGAIDYTKNDLLLGSQDPFFWFLIPLFGLVSAGVCVLLNYAALLLIHVCCFAWKAVSTGPAWFRGEERRRNLGPAFSTASPRRRVLITGILLFLVSTMIPYQFAYFAACIAQLATCTRALSIAIETASATTTTHANFYNYAHSILVLLLWVLPINIPVLVVWVHNLAVHWLTPFSSHHNVLAIAPFILLVETLTGGKMIPRMGTRGRYVTNVLFFILALYAALYGVTFAYQLHYLANLICAWLVGLHFVWGESVSVEGVRRLIEGEDWDGGGKKMP